MDSTIKANFQSAFVIQNMNRICLIGLLFLVCMAWGHNDEESYKYVESLMETVAVAPEGDDCIDDVNDTNEIEIMFPTMDSLFAYEMPQNSCGSGWTTAEKQSAFDKFLMALGTTNCITLSQKYKTAYNHVLPFCMDKNYTNSIIAAKNILKAPTSELKGSAIRLLLSLQRPTSEMNDLVMSMITNKNEMTPYERCLAASTYVESLKINVDCRATVTNAAHLFFQNKYEIEHHIAVDHIMLFAYDNYTNSTNRLEFAEGVLSLTNASPNEITYFSSVTNAIRSSK